MIKYIAKIIYLASFFNFFEQISPEKKEIESSRCIYNSERRKIFMKKWLENTKLLLGICCISILTTIASLSYTLYKELTTKEQTPIKEEIALNTEEEQNQVEEVLKTSFYIEVKGAVNKPGVYEVNNDMLINDAIKLAGGLKSTAYTDNINFSKKVTSEMVIYIFTKSDYKKLKNPSTSTSTSVLNASSTKTDRQDCNTTSYDIGNCTTNASSIVTPGETDTKFVDETPTTAESNIPKIVNINTATVSELTNLSGVGESKAQSIIAYRTEHGSFKTIEEITNVNGIGESIYEKIKANITV